MSSSKKTVALLSGNHICHNPRSLKEADTLAAAGYQVEWLGGWYDEERAERDRVLLKERSWRFAPVVDWTDKSFRGKAGRNFQRACVRIGGTVHRTVGYESAWQLGYSINSLLHSALNRKADLFIAHSEPAMWAAGQLLARGRRVGVDMEDWFSEDLLPEVRRDRPLRLLRELEQTLLAGGAYRTCTSKAMSEVLATAYHCERPAVIYNAFPWSERSKLDGDIKDRHDRSLPSIHWFSQTIGRGRGLEDLLAALPHLKTRVEVHLRGEATTVTDAWISGSVPSDFRPRIFIHSLVHNDELLSRIAEHDIGFAGEPKQPASRDLTVTNKVLQYLLAGIAVVASDTAGQREVAQQASGAVYLYRAGDARHLARQLDFLLSSVTELKKAKSAAVAAANETFCWEKQAPLLLSAVEAALR